MSNRDFHSNGTGVEFENLQMRKTKREDIERTLRYHSQPRNMHTIGDTKSQVSINSRNEGLGLSPERVGTAMSHRSLSSINSALYP